MRRQIKKYGSLFLLTVALSVPFSTRPASAQGTVPANVQSGIDTAIATVGALNGLALAALIVALTPLGAMLTLRFLNMVLSRV
jgi:ACR3 family arsenite efflux pump ArsB